MMGMFDYFVWPSAHISDGQTKDLSQDLICYHLIGGRLFRGGRAEVSGLPASDAPLVPTEYSRDVEVLFDFDGEVRAITLSFYCGLLIDCSDLSMLSADEIEACRASQRARLEDFERRLSQTGRQP